MFVQTDDAITHDTMPLKQRFLLNMIAIHKTPSFTHIFQTYVRLYMGKLNKIHIL